MFYFKSEKFDFWKIYDAIKKYYPIGIKKHEHGIYFSYPSLKELENIIIDNFHNQNHFIERWENFNKSLEIEIGKSIIGTTFGQAPCFSSHVVLETTYLDNLTRTKELHFFISLVGPFYTVIGQDNITIAHKEQSKIKSTSYLVLSPENEFADNFKQLCDKIENQFKGFRFVPFEICTQTIEGLSVFYSDENLNSIFHALFNNQIDLTILNKIGNNYFKSEDWIKEDYVDTGNKWYALPPG